VQRRRSCDSELELARSVSVCDGEIFEFDAGDSLRPVLCS